MTPSEFKAIRAKLGVSKRELAALLGYANINSIAVLESPASGRAVPPLLERLMRAYEAGYRPADWPAVEGRRDIRSALRVLA